MRVILSNSMCCEAVDEHTIAIKKDRNGKCLMISGMTRSDKEKSSQKMLLIKGVVKDLKSMTI